MKSPCPLRSRRGFASIVAISLIPFVGLSLAVVMQSFAADARRTSDAATAAQLRQLLAAATYVASDALSRGSMTSSPVVELPTPLRNSGERVSINLASNGQIATARITASLGPTARTATLIRWQHVGNAWTLMAADVGP